MADPAAPGREAEEAAGLTRTEPDWLVERRREGASLAQELAMPGPQGDWLKAKGWEFTDLSALELDAVRT